MIPSCFVYQPTMVLILWKLSLEIWRSREYPIGQLYLYKETDSIIKACTWGDADHFPGKKIFEILFRNVFNYFNFYLESRILSYPWENYFNFYLESVQQNFNLFLKMWMWITYDEMCSPVTFCDSETLNYLKGSIINANKH